jgi:hexosaminidase
VIVQAWRAGAKAVSAAVAAGHQVIHSPYSHVYLNEGQAGCPLKHVHSWDPTKEGERKKLTRANLSRPELLIGGEACLWGEWCPPERVGWQAYPRLLSVAETLWTGSHSKSYAEFRTRALAQASRLSYLGLTPGPE